MSGGSVRPVTVLHVDDDPDFAETAAAFLERARGELTVDTATSANQGFDRLSDNGIDCVVSDYEMPGQDGLEFLDTVRADRPDLPFILFTGKGSEEVASEAISAGVTDYLQKEPGTDQYEVLANRIYNAVDRHRAEQLVHRAFRAMDSAREGMALLDADDEFMYVNEAYSDIAGYDEPEIIGEF